MSGIDIYRKGKGPTEFRAGSMGLLSVDVTESLVSDCKLQRGLDRFAQQLLEQYKTHDWRGDKSRIIGVSIHSIDLSFILDESEHDKAVREGRWNLRTGTSDK